MKRDPILAALAQYQADLGALNNRRDFLAQDFVEHCLPHGISPSSDRPAPIRAYANTERQLRFGVWAGGILGTAVFALLNARSLEGASTSEIFVASAAFALLIGFLVACLIARLVRVDTKDPNSARRANKVLLLGGATAIVALAAFMYMRFAESNAVRSFFPAAVMAFEIGVMIFTGSAAALIPLYSWPGECVRSYDDASRDIETVQLKIDASLKQLNKEKSPHEENNSAPSTHAVDPSSALIRPNGSAAEHSRGF